MRATSRAAEEEPDLVAGFASALTAIDLLAVCFSAFPAEQQEQAFRRVSEIRLARLAASESLADRMLSSLARAASVASAELTVASYREVRLELRRQGVDVAEVNQLIRYYGSWRAAREALELSDAAGSRLVEVRLQRRRIGKIWRYSEEALRETLARCVGDLGHVPLVAEFDWWRRSQLDLSAKLGDDALHLPSATPYRRRYGTWEAALVHFGYTPDQVAERLERGR